MPRLLNRLTLFLAASFLSTAPLIHAQTPQTALPQEVEIVEEARIEFVKLPDGTVIERHIKASFIFGQASKIEIA
ncbi:MAG: hypothetical protein ABJG15_19220 [Hyphomonadaceae bacterium]